jgi:transcriptional regulator with XRE-family HTH domain
MTLARTVKTLRKNRHINQAEFGKLVGNIDQSTVSRWERGLQRPVGEALRRLAELAQVSPAELLDLAQSPSASGVTEDRGFGEVPQAEFHQPGGAAKRTIGPSEAIRRSPLFGSMKGTTIIVPGVDLTEPADPEWSKVYDDIYDHGVVLESPDRKRD